METTYSVEKLEPGLRFPMGNYDIWWRVLEVDKKEHTALVIADREVCKNAYDTGGRYVTWEYCTLREWLNGRFYEKVFSDEEKDCILERDNITPDNTTYKTKGGADTKDKIWLLSIDEVNKYFKDNDDRNIYSLWWLRSPGQSHGFASFVYDDGAIYDIGLNVNFQRGVRPALLLNLNSPFIKNMFEDEENFTIRVPNFIIREGIIKAVKPGITKVEIPEGVKEISENCFKCMTELKEVKLPSTLKKIGEEAFWACKSLETVTGADGAITYGKNVFYGCKKLKITAEMFHNTGKLCDSFAEHIKDCGPAELAWLIMYQKGDVWEKAVTNWIKKNNGDKILDALTAHIEQEKKVSKKAAAAAADFITENVVLFSENKIRNFCEILAGKKLEELAEGIRPYLKGTHPFSETVTENKNTVTDGNEESSHAQQVMQDGTVFYGRIDVPLEVGSCFFMGNEGTCWRILYLNNKAQTAIVIATREVCQRPYDMAGKNIWKKSGIRQWLNTEYYENTFSEEEKTAILECGTPGETDIKEKILLLSVDEAKKLFTGNLDRRTGSSWVLRSLVYNNDAVAHVVPNGSIDIEGTNVKYKQNIRPAFKINLQSSFFKSLISVNNKGETLISGPEFIAKNGRLISVHGNCTEVDFPLFITEIPGYILSTARQLKRITLPKTVKTVHEYAFINCINLEEINVLNPDLKFEKHAFGESNRTLHYFRDGIGGYIDPSIMPQGLKAGISDICLHMSDEDIKTIVLTEETWPLITPERQAQLFISNQSASLKNIYKRFLTKNNSKGMAECINSEIREGLSVKECSAIALFLTDFTDLISVKTAKDIYAGLLNVKNAEKTLKTIRECRDVMALINSSDENEPVQSREEKILKEAMDSLKTSKRETELKLKDYYALTLKELPGISYCDGREADEIILPLMLTVHGIDEQPYNDERYKKAGIMPEIEKVLEIIDRSSLMQALKSLADEHLVKYQSNKKKYLCYPVCRYADESLMMDLIKRAPGWKTAVSGDCAPPLDQFRRAVKYSNTHGAMIFADKYCDLKEYAALRGMEEADYRDIYLSDIGLDEEGRKEYDLGTQKIAAVLQKNLSFLIEDESGKTMKSVPKKGAEPELYTIAAEDFKNIKFQAKKIVKQRAEKLFEDFLSGDGRNAENWKRAYLKNALIRSVGEHIVWAQKDKTFTVLGKDTITSDGQPYAIKEDTEIKVAHPMEMEEDDILAWQKYFRDNKISQPFPQIWEPAYKADTIQKDRYKGCSIFWRRFQNADKHGIYFYDEDYYDYVGFDMEFCELEYILRGQRHHYVEEDARFELGKFTIIQFNRKVNHIIYLLDKWTIFDRIKKDDIYVMNILESYNVFQIDEFLNVAIESGAVQLTAALMTYKKEHFAEYDAFDEFVLDLL